MLLSLLLLLLLLVLLLNSTIIIYGHVHKELLLNGIFLLFVPYDIFLIEALMYAARQIVVLDMIEICKKLE